MDLLATYTHPCESLVTPMAQAKPLGLAGVRRRFQRGEKLSMAWTAQTREGSGGGGGGAAGARPGGKSMFEAFDGVFIYTISSTK